MLALRRVYLRKFRAVQCTATLNYSSESGRPVCPQQNIDERVLKLRDKLIYCDHLDGIRLKIPHPVYWKKLKDQDYFSTKNETRRLMESETFSVLLKEEQDYLKGADTDEKETEKDVVSKPVHLPYGQPIKPPRSEPVPESTPAPTKPLSVLNQKYKEMYEAYLEQQEAALKKIVAKEDQAETKMTWIRPRDDLSKVPPNWMTDFEQFDDTIIDRTPVMGTYGTPDPSREVSSVPCGGCGALLHCKDPALPGYLPAELFSPASIEDLRQMHCQRCHFLKHYNTALDVQVCPEEYPELLKVIKTKKCAVILMVDLTDFPGSIWQGVADVLHPLTPVFIVGNKVDLLPRDSSQFLTNVTQYLRNYVQEYTNIRPEMIVHTQVISAKTRYGVEELITKLQYNWAYKGDVYLIGCTNVGKSSLFNALLRSDYCKVQATDLVQRATISAWPGTTINLLKFPILYPTSKKRYRRMQRLQETQAEQAANDAYKMDKYKATGNLKYATLTGFVDRTFSALTDESVTVDPFAEKSHKVCTKKLGFDDSLPEYKTSRWCYDTPGTVQPDQVIDLLTTDELLLTLSNRIISPKTFVLHPGQTMFLAGLGRIDYLEGDDYIRCTLFASAKLPLTICHTNDADFIYDTLLETKAFVVPSNDPERLAIWPELASKDFTFYGSSKFESAADVVLSSAGWVAVAANVQHLVNLRAWTPQGRGIYLRRPAFLKYSVSLRGKKISNTPVYKKGKQIYVR